MERQRLAEWEKQRKAELMQHRQREQEKVLLLKAKHEHITNDLDKLVRKSWHCSFCKRRKYDDKHYSVFTYSGIWTKGIKMT